MYVVCWWESWLGTSLSIFYTGVISGLGYSWSALHLGIYRGVVLLRERLAG